jgi:hypothetical protein
VRDLIAQGWSNRAIARHPGTPSRDTVRRWRNQFATDDRPAADGAPGDAPPAHTHAEPAPPGAPPAPDPSADQLTVTLTTDLRGDLAVLTSAGHTPQEAIAAAVQLLADGYGYAWDYGHYDRGTRPDVRTRIVGGRPWPTPVSTTGTGS